MPLAVIVGTLYVAIDSWLLSLSPGGFWSGNPNQFLEISVIVWLCTPILYMVIGAGGYFYGRKHRSALLAGILAAEGWAIGAIATPYSGGVAGGYIVQLLLQILFIGLLIAPVVGGLFGRLGGSIAEGILNRRSRRRS